MYIGVELLLVFACIIVILVVALVVSVLNMRDYKNLLGSCKVTTEFWKLNAKKYEKRAKHYVTEYSSLVDELKSDVFTHVAKERLRQREKWNQDHLKTNADWAVLLMRYVGRTSSTHFFRNNLINIAAIAIAAVQSYDARVKKI